MKRNFLIFSLIVVFLLSVSIFAQDEASPTAGSFALGGITGGHPYIGATVKYWLSDKLALDGSFGFAMNILDLQTNLTFNKKFFDFPKGDMNLVFGGGLWMDFPAGFAFGVQGVAGAEWFIPWAPWGVFAEYRPAFNFFSGNGDNSFFHPFFFSVGARYYF